MMIIGNIVKKITFLMSLVSYGGVIAIMLLNVVDVIMSKTMNKSITGAYEITEVLLLCTIMASFAYGQTKKTHINITIFIKPLPRTIKFLTFGFMGLLSTGTAAVVGYAAILQAQSAISKGAVTSVLMIPMYPFYYIEAIAMFIFSIALLYDTLLALAAIFSKKYEAMVTSGWA
jgi:TRAP-type C4-dicarboxylate transport system permease small subunit